MGHLKSIRTPTLIVQGERDPFGTRDEVARYKLSKAAAETDARYIIFCGVHFMAESADILGHDQQVILPLALESTLSTVSMMAIALVLTLCSTSDAFIAATFVSFPIFARMAFMVFGPMFDLKLFFLYSVLFKKRFVIGLGIGLFVLIGIICSRLLIYVYAGQAL